VKFEQINISRCAIYALLAQLKR